MEQLQHSLKFVPFFNKRSQCCLEIHVPSKFKEACIVGLLSQNAPATYCMWIALQGLTEKI